MAAFNQMEAEKKTQSLIYYAGTQQKGGMRWISMSTIKFIYFVVILAFVGEVHWSWELFFLMVIFFSATVKQVASLAQPSSFLLRKPGQPPSDNSLDSPGLWSQTENTCIHTHRHTPTHTVGVDRQLRGGNVFTHIL